MTPGSAASPDCQKPHLLEANPDFINYISTKGSRLRPPGFIVSLFLPSRVLYSRKSRCVSTRHPLSPPSPHFPPLRWHSLHMLRCRSANYFHHPASTTTQYNIHYLYNVKYSNPIITAYSHIVLEFSAELFVNIIT